MKKKENSSEARELFHKIMELIDEGDIATNITDICMVLTSIYACNHDAQITWDTSEKYGEKIKETINYLFKHGHMKNTN